MSNLLSYYTVKREDGLSAIFHLDNPTTPISGWWDEIDDSGLVSDQSEYYIVVGEGGQQAIFHRDSPNRPVSGWHQDIYFRGLVSGKSEYYAVKESNPSRFSLYRVGCPDSPIISGESLWVVQLLDGISNYVSVGDNYGKNTLYRVVNGLPEKVSKPFREIHPPRYRSVRSDEYYIVKDVKHRGQYAVFSVTNPDTPASRWFDYVFDNHLNASRGKYFVAKKEIGGVMKIGLFSVDSPDHPISGWCLGASIPINGIFTIRREDGKRAIFSIENPTTPISGWWDEIWIDKS